LHTEFLRDKIFCFPDAIDSLLEQSLKQILLKVNCKVSAKKTFDIPSALRSEEARSDFKMYPETIEGDCPRRPVGGYCSKLLIVCQDSDLKIIKDAMKAAMWRCPTDFVVIIPSEEVNCFWRFLKHLIILNRARQRFGRR